MAQRKVQTTVLSPSVSIGDNDELEATLESIDEDVALILSHIEDDDLEEALSVLEGIIGDLVHARDFLQGEIESGSGKTNG